MYRNSLAIGLVLVAVFGFIAYDSQSKRNASVVENTANASENKVDESQHERAVIIPDSRTYIMNQKKELLYGSKLTSEFVECEILVKFLSDKDGHYFLVKVIDENYKHSLFIVNTNSLIYYGSYGDISERMLVK